MHAGFPNAAEDQSGFALSLDKLVIQHPASTYLWILSEPVEALGWLKGDMAVVDRVLTPKPRQFVVAVLDEEFYIRRYTAKGLQRPDGELETTDTAQIWGVITYVVQKAENR